MSIWFNNEYKTKEEVLASLTYESAKKLCFSGETIHKTILQFLGFTNIPFLDQKYIKIWKSVKDYLEKRVTLFLDAQGNIQIFEFHGFEYFSFITSYEDFYKDVCSEVADDVCKEHVERFFETSIYELIDKALDKKDKKEFMRLTNLLKRHCFSVISIVEEKLEELKKGED